MPCYNEAACLDILHARISGAAKVAVGDDYEIVLINDGSRDDSWDVMQRLASADPRLVAINLSRNHGHQLALTAGLDLCAGEQILIIDADLQDPPEPAVRHARGDGGEPGRRGLCGAPPARGRDGVQEGHRRRLLSPADSDDRNADPARHGRFPPDEQAGARCVPELARTGALHSRDGRLDRLPPGALPL
ncbi:glycosyltransferase [Sphingomonas aurantiaca]|uniref:glycosyltransferase n=1 Tax=Sphingomonas aurantiaca TaxID=185949 RepID=UPI003A5BF66C